MFAFALIWLAVALGLAAKSVETASNTPMILFLLVFLSSGFVRIQTMPGGLRQFAEYQPFSPMVDTVRGVLTNAPVGNHAILALAWSLGIAFGSYLWAVRLYNRRRAADPDLSRSGLPLTGHRDALARDDGRPSPSPTGSSDRGQPGSLPGTRWAHERGTSRPPKGSRDFRCCIGVPSGNACSGGGGI